MPKVTIFFVSFYIQFFLVFIYNFFFSLGNVGLLDDRESSINISRSLEAAQNNHHQPQHGEQKQRCLASNCHAKNLCSASAIQEKASYSITICGARVYCSTTTCRAWPSRSSITYGAMDIYVAKFKYPKKFCALLYFELTINYYLIFFSARSGRAKNLFCVE